jgi:hypothetical protein
MYDRICDKAGVLWHGRGARGSGSSGVRMQVGVVEHLVARNTAKVNGGFEHE